jgi:hypothetical protein
MGERSGLASGLNGALSGSADAADRRRSPARPQIATRFKNCFSLGLRGTKHRPKKTLSKQL